MANSTPKTTQMMSIDSMLNPTPPAQPSASDELLPSDIGSGQPSSPSLDTIAQPTPRASSAPSTTTSQPLSLPDSSNVPQNDDALIGYRGTLEVVNHSERYLSSISVAPPARPSNSSPSSPQAFQIMFYAREAWLDWQDRDTLVNPFDAVLARHPSLERGATRSQPQTNGSDQCLSAITCRTGYMSPDLWMQIVAELEAVLPVEWGMKVIARMT